MRLRLQAAHAEVELLRTAIRRLADQDATLSACDGAVTVTMDAALTDEEREAVKLAAEWFAAVPLGDTLRALLGRLSENTEDQQPRTKEAANMMDVVTRINRWLEGEDATDADETLHDARDEIVALRALLKRQSESASEAVRLMSDNASRYGFLLGGLEMVAAGHTTADKVLAAAKAKYGD